MAASDTAPAKKPTESKPAIRYSSSHSGDITLRESYTITSIPDAIMEIIVRVADEAKRLSNMPPSAVTPAASGMLSIPSLVLAAYRALAPTSYPTNISSNMYVYNDCVRIAEQLQDLEVTVELTHPNNNWDTDINIIQSFGKRHYSKEIGLQRTVLCDFLDGAKGFVGCTNFPQSADCQTAISSVVARINGIYTSWSQVLSPSVLFQSVGLLLNTVVTKLINDIEDIPDIPAADSEKICTFFEEIATLESLFPDAPGGAGVSTTGFHCKNWLKFRFLQQILDSRIADILYMFREGHLEGFETEELVDLVKALFADNDNRKKCIDEIRSGGH
jgi:centromere/kinetochore protein ZW10